VELSVRGTVLLLACKGSRTVGLSETGLVTFDWDERLAVCHRRVFADVVVEIQSCMAFLFEYFQTLGMRCVYCCWNWTVVEAF
jgi:hypothetical protein